MPRLTCVNVKKKMVSIKQLNYKAHEKSYVTGEYVGYTTVLRNEFDIQRTLHCDIFL